jgi:hypothetical protein
LHAMAAPSEVDGSWQWTPYGAQRKIGAGAAQEWVRRQGRAGGRTMHRVCCRRRIAVAGRCAVTVVLRVDDAMKVVAVASGESI